MFNSGFTLGGAKMNESLSLAWPHLWNIFPSLRGVLLRLWGSKWLKGVRDDFYNSQQWKDFASYFDHIVLFITYSSREMEIFESDLPVPVSVRFTGTIHDFSILKKHATLPAHLSRNYVFHSPFQIKSLTNSIPKVFIDQTTLAEGKLLDIEIDSQLKVFGMIGLFMEVKQMDTVIEIFQEFPQFKLLLFGAGELQSRFEELIQRLKLKNVSIAGFVPPARIDEIYSLIDCLIINSSEETGPMTGIEAMAAGKLILSREIGAMPDRLEGEELIYKDVEDLRKKLHDIPRLDGPKIVERKMALRAKYLERYSTAILKSAIEALVA
ncbi:hypothetical protein GCM10027454_06930 [Algoriphagus aestuariicola]|jgi:glycosyltransferase involved in cell wall biosynthesis